MHRLAILWTVALVAPSTAQPTRDLQRSSDAIARRDAIDRRYGGELVKLLGSSEPYERFEALARLRTLPELVPAASVPRLIELLDDVAPMHSHRCLQALAHGDTNAQGIIYEQAECARYDRPTNGALARDILKGLPPSATLVGALVDRVRAVPGSVANVAPVLRTVYALPARPVLDALGSATTAAQQRALLEIGYELVPGSADPAGAALFDRLLGSTDLAIATRAALVSLRVSAPPSSSSSDPRWAATRARALVHLRSLIAGDHSADLAELPRIGETGGILAASIIARLKVAGGGLEARRVLIRGLSGMGAAAADAVPVLTRMLADRRLVDLHLDVVATLGAIGSDARAAKGALLGYASRHPDALVAVAASLAGLRTRVTPGELAPLVARYRKRCADAGSIPFFSLSRDDECTALAASLEDIAATSELWFKRTGWDG